MCTFEVKRRVMDIMDFREYALSLPEAEALRERYPEITPAWHFNKRYWSAVAAAGDLPDTLVRGLIRSSYLYTLRNTVTPKVRREELMRRVMPLLAERM